MQPGARIARKYRVLRALGEGAMGSVWAAENELTERKFAIKLIHHRHGMADELRQRMLREARACGRLRHKNVVEVYDVGETDEGDPFLVMQLLDGETLEQLLARRGALPTLQVAAIGFQVASALAAAHEAGIIHRDLKPANIFLHRDPDLGTLVKVLDFGVSKLVADTSATTTTTGAAVGSPAYMSPEQATAKAGIDQRTDLWSAGVVLFEAASGKSAFAGDTAFEVVGNILHGPLPDLRAAAPDIAPRLCSVVERCLVRDPDGRIRSARQLAAELEELLPRSALSVVKDLEDEPTLSNERERPALASGEPVSAPAGQAARTLLEPGSTARKLPRWLPIAAAAALGSIALFLLVLVASTVASQRSTRAPDEARPSAYAGASAATALAPEPVVALAPEPSPPTPVAPATPSASAAKLPAKRSGARSPALCPADKVIFGADGKKRCALAGRRVQ